MKCVLRREDANRNPQLVWNEFIRLLAVSPIDEFDSAQRPAHLAFVYDSEVQNGGHLQYFENQSTALVGESIRALMELGASQQAAVLKSASELWISRSREKPSSVYAHVKQALKMEFEGLDTSYYNLSPSIVDLLEKHLESNPGSFIEFIG